MDVIFQHIRLPLSYPEHTYINALPVFADTRAILNGEEDMSWQIVAVYEHQADEEHYRVFKFTGTQIMRFEQFKTEHFCECSNNHPGRLTRICRLCGREKI